MDFNTAELPNGLRLAHSYDPQSAMVAMDVMYNVGGRDDEPGHYGMAHLFEHLMFGGSANIPDFDAEVEAAGGSDNAWTSDDFTNYWTQVPAQNVETLFHLESDRMLALSFSPRSLEVQRQVVVEEFKQTCLNRPYGDLSHRLRSMLYTVHPYRVPVIGETPAQIEAVDMDYVRQFFYSHYAPNNAVVAVAGNITFGRVMELARKWFSPIPRRDIAPRASITEPEPTEPLREVVVNDNVPLTLITMAFPMGGYRDTLYVGADLLTDVLSAGRSSRFFRRLLEGTELFNDIDASIAGLEECGYLLVNASPRQGVETTRAEAAIRAELDRAMTEAPTDTELRRVITRYESQQIFNSLTSLDKARHMAEAMIHGEVPSERLLAYRAATAADIHRAAVTLLAPHRARTLIYGPA